MTISINNSHGRFIIPKNEETANKIRLKGRRKAIIEIVLLLTLFTWPMPFLVGHENHHHHPHLIEDSRSESTLAKADASSPFSKEERVDLLKRSLDEGLDTMLLTKRVLVAQGSIDKNGYTRENLSALAVALIGAVRTSQNEALYKTVLDAIDLTEDLYGSSAETRLWRGHVWLQWHRFSEAESIARELVIERGEFEDYALLGDALLEQGKIEEAGEAYRQFAGKTRTLPAHARIAQLAWEKGEEAEAIRNWSRALRFGSSADPESIAWCRVQLGEIYLSRGDLAVAGVLADSVLNWKADHAAGAFLKGRVSWFKSDLEESTRWLRVAAKVEPLPIRLWWLRDVLREKGDHSTAQEVQRRLLQKGVPLDPRSGAIFLAFEQIDGDRALFLAEAEFDSRKDRQTLDTLGYCHLIRGEVTSASRLLGKAASKGVLDGRIYYHLGLLSAARRQPYQASTFLEKAAKHRFTLTPSEFKAAENLRQRESSKS